MFKKILSLVLAAATLAALGLAFVSCDGGEGELKGLSESPLPAPEVSSNVTVPADFKIGFICLHDEKSTYDKNFLDAANEVIEALGLKKIGDVSEQPDNAATKGKIAQISYMIKVED